jgi:XTP/dITP diphosphohydrolase
MAFECWHWNNNDHQLILIRDFNMVQLKNKDLYFVSSNPNKFREIAPMLQQYGIDSQPIQMSIQEIQSESVHRIAEAKATYAFKHLLRPVVIEDDGFYISSLNGFPGQYSSFIYKTLGNQGILKLMLDKVNRRAYFLSVIAYNDGHTLKMFSGKTQGIVSKVAAEGGWGFDPIFLPKNTNKTYAELSRSNRKSFYSHRRKSIEKFSKWYITKRLQSEIVDFGKAR